MVAGQSESDLLQQALENSGLTNDAETSACVSSKEAGPARTSSNNNISLYNKEVNTADGRLPSGLTNGTISPSKVHVVRRGLVSTMAVHDSVTGTVRRHFVRKVVTFELLLLYEVILYLASCVFYSGYGRRPDQLILVRQS
jgi:hypothetical protein